MGVSFGEKKKNMQEGYALKGCQVVHFVLNIEYLYHAPNIILSEFSWRKLCTANLGIFPQIHKYIIKTSSKNLENLNLASLLLPECHRKKRTGEEKKRRRRGEKVSIFRLLLQLARYLTNSASSSSSLSVSITSSRSRGFNLGFLKQIHRLKSKELERKHFIKNCKLKQRLKARHRKEKENISFETFTYPESSFLRLEKEPKC